MISLDKIIEASGLHPYKIKNVYLFGSQCYGVNTDFSDYDILIIANTPYEEKEIVVDNLNIHILTLDRFLEGLRQFNIRNIECLFSPCIFQEKIEIPFKIKEDSLRHSISHTVSNSYVKAKKKIQQGDTYIGLKSLYHSMRIAMFGIQLMENNKIIDWGEANYIWKDLFSKNWTWEELHEKYKPLRNNLMSKFRGMTHK